MPARLIRLLVERVDVGPDGIDVRLRTEGLGSLVAELRHTETKGVQEDAA